MMCNGLSPAEVINPLTTENIDDQIIRVLAIEKCKANGMIFTQYASTLHIVVYFKL